MALPPESPFVNRHLGPDDAETAAMLETLGFTQLDDLIAATVPGTIRLSRPLDLPPGKSEHALQGQLAEIAAQNQVFRSFIGEGYYDCVTPQVIQRNILENPGWYTAYTPYQAEIAQGRLEALLNYQTMIRDLTGLDVANASLLDEATAAAEAMAMCFAVTGRDPSRAFFVSKTCHPQTIEVVRTRAKPLGIAVVVGDHRTFDLSQSVFGVLVQYPATDGALHDYRTFFERAHAQEALCVTATDLLALSLLTPPGEFGADVAVGTSQRFGVPLGYGGPHAAFFATRNEYVRQMPGRLIGISEDAQGRAALRMALQPREQHIRREKATSNICTAQVLLAVVSSMYAVYHGPKGLSAIAQRVHALTRGLSRGLARLGLRQRSEEYFDTLCVEVPGQQDAILAAAEAREVNLRRCDEGAISISLDETTTEADVVRLLEVFGGKVDDLDLAALCGDGPAYGAAHARTSPFLTHPVFNTYHSETELQRYMRRLEAKDLSLTHSMIPLGSCTMKLTAAAEMAPITWPAFGRIHPFAPKEQAAGYHEIFRQLERALAEITGFPAISLQPNAGSQGEYAGLLVLRRYHESRGEGGRDVCLIPASAHGTNPASASMAGLKVVVVKCDERGNIDLADLAQKADERRARLSALMVTYPSTHGVFEEGIKEVCAIVHARGGQVYMDGANMNAQVGLCRPGDIGADVCHLNLHKTFCVPHGGGGPGAGPIGVAAHLKDFLPRHPVIGTGGPRGIGPVSAAPWGSANILLISWSYITLMGGEGLTRATKVAILNANYLAKRISEHFPVLYKGAQGTVAHECILDMRNLKRSSGVEVEDVAKRLMDYGFHAPTVSFPVASTMMVEPTESESRAELDRFCEAMALIRKEIQEIEDGAAPREGNLLKNAPHTAEVVVADRWERPYSRERAAFPTPWVRRTKFWPSVGRLNNVLGDRKLVCNRPPVEEDGSTQS
jgi:glycine dehydrogenase